MNSDQLLREWCEGRVTHDEPEMPRRSQFIYKCSEVGKRRDFSYWIEGLILLGLLAWVCFWKVR